MHLLTAGNPFQRVLKSCDLCNGLNTVRLCNASLLPHPRCRVLLLGLLRCLIHRLPPRMPTAPLLRPHRRRRKTALPSQDPGGCARTDAGRRQETWSAQSVNRAFFLSPFQLSSSAVGREGTSSPLEAAAVSTSHTRRLEGQRTDLGLLCTDSRSRAPFSVARSASL